MPRLSDTMEEGTVAKWLKKVGDTVEEGDILAEIETDKATMELESFDDGTVAKISAPEGDQIVAAASTVQKDLREGLEGTGNVSAAVAVGKAIAEKAKEAGVTKVAFDRSGFRYHGRVKALAEAAREHGLEF